MPEQVFSYIRNHVKKEWILCFISTFVLGLAAHFYKLTNFLPNWDSLVFYYDKMDMTHFGRYLLSPACAVGTYYDLPWVNGLLSLIYIGLTSVCICELFDMRRKITIILCSGLLAAFPSVTSTLMYNYTADGYFLALFCACLSALFMLRGKKGIRGILPAAFLLMVSMGIYQAYLSVAVMLVLVYLADRILFGEESMGAIAAKAGRCLTCGISGAALYYLVLQVVLKLSGTGLSDYQNVESAFSFANIRIWEGMKKCVVRFLEYFFDFSQGIQLLPILNILLFCALLFFVAKALAVLWQKRELGRFAAALAVLFCMPFGACILYFADTGLDYHNLMLMGYAMFYIGFVLFYERSEDGGEGFLRWKQWGILIIAGLCIFDFILIANVSYGKLERAYEKSYGALIRIADRISRYPGAAEYEKLAVMGMLSGSMAYGVDLPPDMTGTTDSYIIRFRDPQVGQNVLLSALKDYCEMEYEDVTQEELERILASEEYQAMERWPQEGCIREIDGILVLRLEEELDERLGK